MNATYSPSQKDSDKRKIDKLSEKFREGKIDLETYMNNLPKRSKKKHSLLWQGIFESFLTDPKDESEMDPIFKTDSR